MFDVYLVAEKEVNYKDYRYMSVRAGDKKLSRSYEVLLTCILNIIAEINTTLVEKS